MSVAPRAGPAPRNRCPGPNRGPGLRARDVGYGNATDPGTQTTGKNTSPRGDQDLAGFRSDLRAGVARRRDPRYPRRPQQTPAVGRLGGLSYGRPIEESGACGLNPQHGRTWRPRSRLRRGTRGAPVRKRGPAWPWSMSASIAFRGKKTVNFAWEKYHAVREQSRSTGATGSAAELAGFMPP
jgi:hypothetical protein